MSQYEKKKNMEKTNAIACDPGTTGTVDQGTFTAAKLMFAGSYRVPKFQRSVSVPSLCC